MNVQKTHIKFRGQWNKRDNDFSLSLEKHRDMDWVVVFNMLNVQETSYSQCNMDTMRLSVI
jgi:hypothetical protein